MTRLVLDASIILKWFRNENESRRASALSLRDGYLAGRIHVVAPTLLFVEVINVVARKWSWSGAAILELAEELDALGFETLDPAIAEVAAWAAEGLTAYDAVYVALAQEQHVSLLTDDRVILQVAPEVARPLAQWGNA